MSIAFWVMIVGAAVYIITTAIGKYSELGELGRIAFFAGLLVVLMK